MHSGWAMKDGSRYTGQFRRGFQCKDGIGYIIYPDGSLFEGVFRNDDTVKGRYIFTNGYVYEGDMKCHKVHGSGRITYDGEEVFQGQFENGERWDQERTMNTTDSQFSTLATPEVKEKRMTIQFNL